MSPGAPTPDAIEFAGRFGGELDRHEGHDRCWLDSPPNDLDTTAAAALEIDWVETRRLHQMRRPLPVHEHGSSSTRPIIETRSFDVDRDVDAWLRVNNAAFSWHPDQGGKTAEDVAATMAEPWFDADGFRILELDGQMAGFCWTKVHADENPPLGEIYVIAVDPAFGGRGLGGALTLDGLQWMHDHRGVDLGMLYVEANNTAALATYDGLGFEVFSTRVAYEPLDDFTPDDLSDLTSD